MSRYRSRSRIFSQYPSLWYPLCSYYFPTVLAIGHVATASTAEGGSEGKEEKEIDWLQDMDYSKYTGSVFVDLRKAFDTVDHQILMKKMHNISIKNMSCDWTVL